MTKHSIKEDVGLVVDEVKHIAHAVDQEATQFERSIGLISNFSLGFTYLSPLTAVYSLFALAITLAGPPSIWWILIVAIGQLLVAMVFGKPPHNIQLQADCIRGRGVYGGVNTRGWQHGFISGL